MVEPSTTNYLSNYEAMPQMSPEELKGLKETWTQLSVIMRKRRLCALQVCNTHVYLLKPSFVPHEFASDTCDIENQDLVDLLYDSKNFYENCGKTEKILSMIRACPGRTVLVTHANSLEVEMSDRMQLPKYDDAFKKLRIIFLGPSLRQKTLPILWAAWSPLSMDDDQIQEILLGERVLVVGTV